MPNVSVTMSDKAYDIFREWEKGHRSQRVSAAICLWNAQVLEAKYEIRPSDVKE